MPSCQKEVIAIINGEAKLVSDVYRDGLGACLGECPEGALSIEERNGHVFDAAKAALFRALTTKARAF